MEGETSKQRYKLVEYKDIIYEIPIRKIDNGQQQIILWSDVLSIAPKATCCLCNGKLVPFQLDEHLNELIPKRMSLNSEEEESVWEIHVPNDNQSVLLDQIATKLDYLIQHHLDLNQDSAAEQGNLEDESNSSTTNNNNSSNSSNDNIPSVDNNSTHNDDNDTTLSCSSAGPSSSRSLMPATSPTPSRHEAPPSYETSILSTLHALASKLRVFESHIPNRHKSPKWLAKRETWVSQEANSIEEIAYLLVQLEMALLWTAVTEGWIEEREIWLTLVGNSRSERHLASAILNLERHTLVMDESWSTMRERWVGELLEMVAIPLSHG